MKQAMIVIDDINRMIDSVNKSNSKYLKNDYRKNINRLIKELRTYCIYRNINFNELKKMIKREVK